MPSSREVQERETCAENAHRCSVSLAHPKASSVLTSRQPVYHGHPTFVARAVMAMVSQMVRTRRSVLHLDKSKWRWERLPLLWNKPSWRKIAGRCQNTAEMRPERHYLRPRRLHLNRHHYHCYYHYHEHVPCPYGHSCFRCNHSS